MGILDPLGARAIVSAAGFSVMPVARTRKFTISTARLES